VCDGENEIYVFKMNLTLQIYQQDRLEVFRKSSSNVYHPGPIRFVQDYCALMRGETSVITQTMAKNYELFKARMKPCPVMGKHMFENVPFDSSLMPQTLLPSGEFRVDLREYNELNETIFAVQYYITVKNPFF
jgi:Protein of unknown function (DUF1091)